MNLPLRTAFAVLASSIVSLSAQDSALGKVEIRMLAFSSAQQKKEAFAHDPLADPTAAAVPAPIKTYLNHQFSTVVLKSRKIVFTTKISRDSMKTPEDDRRSDPAIRCELRDSPFPSGQGQEQRPDHGDR
jgi:hypothetical protein